MNQKTNDYANLAFMSVGARYASNTSDNNVDDAENEHVYAILQYNSSGNTCKPTNTTEEGVKNVKTKRRWICLALIIIIALAGAVITLTTLLLQKERNLTEVDGGWGSWSSFSPCSDSCGGGSQNRNRHCDKPYPSNGGKPCFGNSSETRACNLNTCSVDGGWGSWSSFSLCSDSCGGGSQNRNRHCDKPYPSNGGKPCFGNSSETRACNSSPCSVDGGWGSWSSFTLCSDSCGGGSQNRNRHCDKPYPSNGGKPCFGNQSETRACNSSPCSVDGGWGSWSSFSLCSDSCGGGSQNRNRYCDKPYPSNGGKPCFGDSSETRACNSSPCSVDGRWGSWTSFSQCSDSCGGRSQNRNRYCDSPYPSNGGKSCLGNSSETRACNSSPCLVDGGWGSWSSFSQCSDSCGDGSQNRNRSCDNPYPSNGGRSCFGNSSETRSCNSSSCSLALFPQNAHGVNLTYMVQCLRDYFSKRRHHDVDQAYKDRTMHFVQDEFVKYGLETELQVFQEPLVSNSTIFTNVIGIQKGEKFGQLDDRIVGIGAHYDTVTTTPGIDDNGAGVVAMLEALRQLTERQERKRKNTMIFVSFDIEEEGLFGSKAFVNQWFLNFLEVNYGPQFRNMTHYGFIVLDAPMLYNDTEYSQSVIGSKGSDLVFAQYFPDIYAHMKASNFRGDFLCLIYRKNSFDYVLANSFRASWMFHGRQKYKLESFAVPVKDNHASSIFNDSVLSNFLRSDHTNFWLKGFPSLLLSDSANFRRHGSSCYHRACDNVEVYITEDNMNFLGKTTDSMAKALEVLSDSQINLSASQRTQATGASIVLALVFRFLQNEL